MATADPLVSAPYTYNFLMMSDYPCGQFVVPRGTLIQLPTRAQAVPDPSFSWSRYIEQSGEPVPITSQPLDQASFNYMAALYPKYRIFTVPGADNIDRSQGPNVAPWLAGD